jgi:hypothetical protein
MTKEEFKAKIAEMLPDVLKYLENETAHLANSGAAGLADEPPETYGMAKNILAVALERAATQYTPPKWDRTRWKHIKNLRHF